MQAVFEKLAALEADLSQGEVGETFLAMVDKVMVGEKLTFVLKDGSKWETER